MSEEGSNRTTKEGFRLTPRAAFGIVVVVLALAFILQNSRTGRVEFLLWTINAPAWLWMVSLLAAGFVIGSLFPWFKRKSRG